MGQELVSRYCFGQGSAGHYMHPISGAHPLYKQHLMEAYPGGPVFKPSHKLFLYVWLVLSVSMVHGGDSQLGVDWKVS